MTGECVCGAVSITIDEKPEFINDCNCGLCRKTGAAWGYFSCASVSARGETTAYNRSDKRDPIVEVYSCNQCACTTHFGLTRSFKQMNPSIDQVGVNMRLFDPDLLHDVEVRFPNGKAWSGEGPFGYRRQAMILSESMPW